MSEMLLSEMQLAGGGSYSPDSFLGGFITALLGTRQPSRGEASQGAHVQQLIDMWYSWAERVAAASPLYVYKDSTDSNVQLSVSAAPLHQFGQAVNYAGQINVGPMTAGVLNYIYLPLTDLAALAVAISTAGWPATTPHIKLATINMPASGPWRVEHIVRMVGAQALQPSGVAVVQSSIEVPFNYNTASPITLCTIPAGARVDEAFVEVTTTFNGGFTATIGDGTVANRHMAAGDATWGTLGSYTKRNFYRYTVATPILLTLIPSAASQGAGRACVKWRF